MSNAEGTTSPEVNVVVDVLVAAFAQVLKSAAGVDGDTDFFEAGGNSVLALRLVARVRTELDPPPAMRDVFVGRTPARIAQRLVENR